MSDNHSYWGAFRHALVDAPLNYAHTVEPHHGSSMLGGTFQFAREAGRSCLVKGSILAVYLSSIKTSAYFYVIRSYPHECSQFKGPAVCRRENL